MQENAARMLVARSLNALFPKLCLFTTFFSSFLLRWVGTIPVEATRRCKSGKALDNVRRVPHTVVVV